MKEKTLQKYAKILEEISKHDSLPGREIRKIISDYGASNAVEIAMKKLGYISNTERGKPLKVNIKEVQPIHVRRLVDTSNKREKYKKEEKIKYKTANEPKNNDDLLTKAEAFEFIEHRITAHIDHHVFLAHQSLIKSWFKKNQVAILSTAITVLVIAAIIAAFLLGKSL